MIDIANAYADAGYQVNLIAGRLVQRNKSLRKGVTWQKIIRYDRSSTFKRLFSWGIAMLQILWLLWFRFRKDQLLIVSNPPFAPLIPLLCKNEYSLLIYDVYIEKPSEFPFIGKIVFLINLWKKAHKKVLVKAKKIFTLTEGMKRNIEKYSGGKLVIIVPIWTDNVFLKPLAENDNPFLKAHNLEDKFIVLYSGNIGMSSGVETLVDIAAKIHSEKIRFVIIGEGIRKKSVIEKVNKLQLSNCLILPWQKTDMLPYSLASANLAVVSLVGKSSKRSIPSKLFNFLSVGVPILGIADLHSDLAKLIKKYDIGICFLPENIDEISDYIKQLANNPNQYYRYSQNSRKASKEHTVKNVQKFL